MNQLELLDLKSLDILISILPKCESLADKEKKLKNKIEIIRKNDEWERLYYLGFRKT